MDTKSIEEMIHNMNAEMANMREAYQAKMKVIFQDAFKEYFKECPEVTAFGWRQYTPYFNDGDECVFRCNVDYGFVTNAKDYQSGIQYGEYEGDQENVWIEDPDYGDFNEELIPEHVIEKTKILRRVLSKIDDDVYLQIFGDHCKVYATPAGFDVEEYEHD